MADIRIADLREPQRNDQELQLFEMACGMEVDLDPERLIDAARRRTGLREFGDPTLVDRLALQVAAVEADAGLSGLGRFLIRRRLVGLLAARLRFEAFVAHNPQALEIELEPPIIVVGLPRSGTTHLVNLLAVDPRLRSLPWWEAVEPIPVAGDGPGRDGIDPRFLRSLAEYEAATAVSPLTALMHDRTPSSIEEECELADLDLSTYVLEWHARVPQWRDAADHLNHTAHYEFLRRELQVLSYLRGPNRWVLKCPQHLERLGPLMATFPRATIAFTLRDPVAVVQSAITMLAYGDRNRRLAIDADGLAYYWVDRVERLLRASLRDSHLIPADQRIDVEFHRCMADEIATAAKVLEANGLEVGDQQRGRFAQYSAEHPRGRDGRVVYNLREDFGIEPETLYQRYAFYFEAFPQLTREVV